MLGEFAGDLEVNFEFPDTRINRKANDAKCVTWCWEGAISHKAVYYGLGISESY
jgi:hypothetical protein